MTALRDDDRDPIGEPAHLVIECVTPELDGGRFAVKRTVGDDFEIGVDIFKDGHDLLSGCILYMRPADRHWRRAPLVYSYDHDRWFGHLALDQLGAWRYTVEAWVDAFATWRSELEKKADAGLDVDSELVEGVELIRGALRNARGVEHERLDQLAYVIGSRAERGAKVAAALSDELTELMRRHGVPIGVTRYDRELVVRVDRERASFAAWYEFFPRSTAPAEGAHGTFRDAEAALPRIARLGFDLVYLPPIHPIGTTHRKGRNNALVAEPGDPGSPWAIGNEHGGHTAVNPELGTLEDFRRFVAAAESLGLEVALDYALQCSPDHPWVREHPEWFYIRPDGTVKYAENPPKKYEDIYPLNFWCEDREALWDACRDIFLFWIGHGVRTFRVDNPHTKPFAFWDWVIADVQREHPDVVFLAEAFTRPKRMKHLAKLGFTQSYTYFTWRNEAAELRDYLTELTASPMVEYFRGNFFANTPDILNEFLVHGGRPAFRIRLALAATLLPIYGIYSGFELAENVPVRPDSEEYVDSEKYQIRRRDWSSPESLDEEIAMLNALRRREPALRRYANLTFHESGNPSVLFYVKSAWRRDLLIAVTTDPCEPQEAELAIPFAELGLDPEAPVTVEDLLGGERVTWHGPTAPVTFDPGERVAAIWRVVRGDEDPSGA